MTKWGDRPHWEFDCRFLGSDEHGDWLGIETGTRMSPTGRVWIDDEDEFADHRVRFGYPEDVARGAMTACDRVHAAVVDARAPYDGSAATWLTRLGDALGR